MHLLEDAVVHLDINELRRKNDRDAGGGGKNVAEQLERLRPSTRGDRAHIPDDGSLRVKIGRDNHKAPSLFILARDGVDYIVVEIALDELSYVGFSVTA
jgi:hypothetical protein